LVLSNSHLNITINSANESLTLTAGLSAGGKNVTVTSPLQGTFWDVAGNTAIPGGTLTVQNAPVTGIGTLALNYVNMHIAGVSVEAQAVTGGSSFLFLEGGSLVRPGSGTNPSVDVLKFDLSGGSTYTALTGTTVRTSVLSSADSSGVFTLDGGTLAINPMNGTGFIGYDYNGSGALPLAAFYLGAHGGTIDCGNQWIGIGASMQDAPGVTGGPLTVTNGGALSDGVSGFFTGGTFIRGGSCVYSGVTDSLGTGTIDVSEGASLAYSAGGVVSNELVFHGPGKSTGAYTALFLDWNSGSIEFSGQITLNDGPGTPGDPLTFTDMGNYAGPPIITLSGKITGPGGLLYGLALEPNWFYNGVLQMTGKDSNDYAGATWVVGEILALGKDNTLGSGVNTAVAVPNDLVLDPSLNGLRTWTASAAALLADNQTTTNTVVHFNSPSYAARSQWTNFALNGHATTVRGLVTLNPDGLNGVDNLSIAHNLGVSAIPDPTGPGTLTITTQDGDNFVYAGYIRDHTHDWAGMPTIPPLAIVKDGPGTQTFVTNTTLGTIDTVLGQNADLSNIYGWGPYAMFHYTGGTTVKGGTLDISGAQYFTWAPHIASYTRPDGTTVPEVTEYHSPMSVEGGTLALGAIFEQNFSSVALKSGSITGSVTLTSQTDFDMQAGSASVGLAGAVRLMKTTAGTVTLTGPLTYTGDTIVNAGTLNVTNLTASPHVYVATGATLNATSIVADTLTIGGPQLASAAAVPEPSTLLLLALAGLGALPAWRRK
jgi:autotransporter-associated beta strand protein